jgi:putative hydrolase of the HAD superfamily
LYHKEMAQAGTRPVNWEQIDTVLVDMDGTLLDLAFDNFFWLDVVPQHYAQLQGVSIDDAKAQLSPRFAAVAGTLAWYCLDHWTRDLGIDLRALKRRHRNRIRFLPGAPEFLAAVRRRGKRLCIVTNAHRDTFAVKAEQTGIDRLVDGVVCSHELAAPKEHGDFWQELQRRERFDNERTLLLEDSLAVLTAAARHGLRHILAIRRPDSSLPARIIADFAAIDGVADIV